MKTDCPKLFISDQNLENLSKRLNIMRLKLQKKKRMGEMGEFSNTLDIV